MNFPSNTTLAGFLVVAAAMYTYVAAALDGNPNNTPSIEQTASMLAIGLGLIAAKDNHKEGN
jgi:hypothetical protein